MGYKQLNFGKYEFSIEEKQFKYYLSPILFKNNFKHGFFTRTSSKIDISVLSKNLNINNINSVLNQVHSNKVVLGSKSQVNAKVEADGLINDKHNQNLWIYTADCMPILFADKRKRFVAAIHCGRKGLETKIIKNLIKKFYDRGCSKDDLLVAIGPSISKKNYLIDNKTLNEFFIHTFDKRSISFLADKNILLKYKRFINDKNQILIPLDLKKIALIQLLNENILSSNIDISNICTYESNQDFHSWRRTKTYLRQWNFISPKRF